MNYFNKDKKNTNSSGKPKRTNWDQSLRSASVKTTKVKKIKKSLQYLLLLKKVQNN